MKKVGGSTSSPVSFSPLYLASIRLVQFSGGAKVVLLRLSACRPTQREITKNNLLRCISATHCARRADGELVYGSPSVSLRKTDQPPTRCSPPVSEAELRPRW